MAALLRLSTSHQHSQLLGADGADELFSTGIFQIKQEMWADALDTQFDGRAVAAAAQVSGVGSGSDGRYDGTPGSIVRSIYDLVAV